jgi:hypothetical protein
MNKEIIKKQKDINDYVEEAIKKKFTKKELEIINKYELLKKEVYKNISIVTAIASGVVLRTFTDLKEDEKD